MNWATRISLWSGVGWAGLGCLALAGLWKMTDAQFVGYTLFVPAVPIGLVCEALRIPRGVLFVVRDGWPTLTWLGVFVVYLVPALVVLGFVARGRLAK